jgi:hypothetical protein
MEFAAAVRAAKVAMVAKAAKTAASDPPTPCLG